MKGSLEPDKTGFESLDQDQFNVPCCGSSEMRDDSCLIGCSED